MDHQYLETALTIASVAVFVSVGLGVAYLVLRSDVDALRRRVLKLEQDALDAATRAAAPPETPLVAPPASPTPQPAVAHPSPDVPRAAPPPPVVAPPRAPQPALAELSAHARAPAPAPTPAPRRSGAGLEQFLGGRVLLVAGVVALLLTIGFFLKYAIDRELIGRGARLAIGIVAGAATAVCGEVLRRRGFGVFGQSITGLGLGALYLCDFFASVRYEFIGRPVAFALIAALTAAGAVHAVRIRGPFLAWLAFTGAWLAPVLLGADRDALEGLTVWLLVVDAGVLAVLARRPWRGLDTYAAVASLGYFAAWAIRHGSDARAAAGGACVLALLVASIAVCIAPAVLQRRTPIAASLVGVLGAALVASVSSWGLLVPEHRHAFASGLAAVAVLLAATARLVDRRIDGARSAADAIHGIAVALLATAVPAGFEGATVTILWSALGAAAIHAERPLGRTWLGGAGLAFATLGACAAAVRMAAVGGEPAFGLAFWSALAPAATFGYAAWSRRDAPMPQRDLGSLALVAATWGTTILCCVAAYRAAPVAGARQFHAWFACTCLATAPVVAIAAVATRLGRYGSRVPQLLPSIAAIAATIAMLATDPPAGTEPFAHPGVAGGAAVIGAFVVAAAFGKRPALGAGLVALGLFVALVSTELARWAALRHPHDAQAAGYLSCAALVAFWSLVAIVAAWIHGRRGVPAALPVAAFLGGLAAVTALASRPGFEQRVGFESFRLEFAAALLPAVIAVVHRIVAPRSAAARFAHLAAVVYAVAVVTVETVAWGDHGAIPAGLVRDDLRFRAQVAISVAWAVASAALVGAGFLRRDAILRWGGIGGFLLTVAKVVFIDLARLDTVSRVGSFFALGLLLVATSYLYQRRRRDDTPGGDSEPPAGDPGTLRDG